MNPTPWLDPLRRWLGLRACVPLGLSQLAGAVALALVATTADAQVLRMRALAAPWAPAPALSGEVAGLLRSDGGRPVTANVLLIQGMGWTQRAGQQPNNLRLVRAIEQAHGLGDSTLAVRRLCPDSDAPGPRHAAGGVRLFVDETWDATDDPRTPIGATAMACLDRVTIDLPDGGRITVYRLQWDDLVYDAYQYPHIGYDDALMGGHEAGQAAADGRPAVAGYENLSALRSADNAVLKTQLVSYGLSEAALYLGPRGELLRQAVAAAMCIVADQAAGGRDRFAALEQRQARDGGAPEVYDDVLVSDPGLCAGTGAPDTPARLGIVTESLGSRIVFDVLGLAGPPALHARLQALGLGQMEVFLLANQIPLLAPARLQPWASPAGPRTIRPRLIAVSEIDDPLSFELVPYFEHLYVLRCRQSLSASPRLDPACTAPQGSDLLEGLRRLQTDTTIRQALAAEIGFDVVDVRVRFAQPYSRWVSGFADPMHAHTGHLGVPVLRQLLLCGASGGQVRGRAEGCTVR